MFIEALSTVMPTEYLLAEVKRRREISSTRVCPYCGMDADWPPCKKADLHLAVRNSDDTMSLNAA